MTTSINAFPLLRWVGLIGTGGGRPAYIRFWGWANLLHLCDIAVILGCAGLWWGSSLLISSQAVNSLVAGVFWSVDIGWRLATGRFLVGGTEYMWDARVPIWARLFSCFHIGLPLALLWAMRKTGYDRRALALQAAIAAGPFFHLPAFCSGVQKGISCARSPFLSSSVTRSLQPSLVFF